MPCSATELTVTGAVPDEVRVTDCVAVEPTGTFPKGSEVALTSSCGVVATVPVPLSWTMVVAPLEELLVIFNCPVAAPAAVGSNSTCSVTAWFGFSVTGKVAPESAKPAPLSVAALIVTGAVPEEVSVSGSVAVEFTATFPKDSEPTLTVNCAVVATVPLPLSATFAVPPVVESLLIVS